MLFHVQSSTITIIWSSPHLQESIYIQYFNRKHKGVDEMGEVNLDEFFVQTRHAQITERKEGETSC